MTIIIYDRHIFIQKPLVTKKLFYGYDTGSFEGVKETLVFRPGDKIYWGFGLNVAED